MSFWEGKMECCRLSWHFNLYTGINPRVPNEWCRGQKFNLTRIFSRGALWEVLRSLGVCSEDVLPRVITATTTDPRPATSYPAL